MSDRYGYEKREGWATFHIQDLARRRTIAECPTERDAQDITKALNHTCSLPESIQWALNSGDGTYRP